LLAVYAGRGYKIAKRAVIVAGSRSSSLQKNQGDFGDITIPQVLATPMHVIFASSAVYDD
jgi:hypothetical protein